MIPQPQKKGMFGAAMRSLTKFIGKKMGNNLIKKLREKAEEETNILATRFLSFDEGVLLITRYLPHKPLRNYGNFSSNPNERSRPIPETMWDAMAVNIYPVKNLK